MSCPKISNHSPACLACFSRQADSSRLAASHSLPAFRHPLTSPIPLPFFLLRPRKRAKKKGAARRGAGFSANLLSGENVRHCPETGLAYTKRHCWTEKRGKNPLSATGWPGGIPRRRFERVLGLAASPDPNLYVFTYRNDTRRINACLPLSFRRGGRGERSRR